jgi:hypothetical protein
MTPQQQRAMALAEKIGVPTKIWPGKCYTIASAALDSGFITGTLCYGMYAGKVANGSYFDGHTINGFCRHGWVQREDGSIFDPTRWVFEDVQPYIYEGAAGRDYDYGMERFKMMFDRSIRIPCPAFEPDTPTYDLPDNNYLALFIKAVCGIPTGSTKMSRNQAFWLANRLPRQLGSNTSQVFEWLVCQGLKAYIPIDFQLRYLTEDGRAKELVG